MTKPGILISVIIPTYNDEDVVAHAISSVLRQTGLHHIKEIIVVDDGSVDGTVDCVKDIIKGHTTKPTIKLLQQPNGGPSRARNTGVKETKSDWIALLDSDDTWKPQKIKLQVETLKRYPEIVFLGTSTDRTHVSHGKKIGERLYRLDIVQFLYKSRIATSTVLMRKDILLECGGFDETMRYAEDQNLFMKIAAKAGLHSLSIDLATPASKPIFGGQSGLAANLAAMHQGCRKNLRLAFRNGYIRLGEYILLVAWEQIKYLRRQVIRLANRAKQ